jgi:hypothetical protein
MKKTSILSAVALAAVILIAACQIEPAGPVPAAVNVTKAEQNLDTVAQNAAVALTGNQGFLKVLKEEIGKKFDGEPEVLYKTIAGMDIGNGKTVQDALEEAYAKQTAPAAGRGNAASLSSLLSELDGVMNLQLYMPNFDSWDGKTTPLIAFLPITVDERDMTQITAFDGTLNETVITAENLASQNLIIVGPNERTDSTGALRTDMIFESGATRGDPTVRDGADEYLASFTPFKSFEGLFMGKGEFVIQFTPGILKQVVADKHASLDGNQTGNFGPVSGRLFPWYEKDFGTLLFYNIYEDDIDFTAEIKVEVSYGGDKSKVKGSVSATFKIGGGDDKVGCGVIHYLDAPGSYGDTTYVMTMDYNRKEPSKPTEKPIPRTPAGSTAGSKPQFSWDGVPGATHYTLYVYKKSDNSMIAREIGILGTSFTFAAALPFNTPMYWNVYGYSDGGDGPKSDNKDFTLIDAPTPAMSPTPT